MKQRRRWIPLLRVIFLVSPPGSLYPAIRLRENRPAARGGNLHDTSQQRQRRKPSLHQPEARAKEIFNFANAAMLRAGLEND